MIRTEDSNLADELPESNSIIEKMMLISKRLKYLRATDIVLKDSAFEQELKEIVGDAIIRIGIFTGSTIKTLTITKEGVKIHEEPKRSKALDYN